jgi:hypothetical protein
VYNTGSLSPYGNHIPALEPNNTFSKMLLWGTNAAWLLLIIASNPERSLFASIFLMHLYTKLRQAIGLKSPIIDGLGILGTKVSIVALDSLRSFPDWKKDFIASIKFLPTTNQALWKNSTRNPSGPRALELLTEKIENGSLDLLISDFFSHASARNYDCCSKW